MRVRGKKCKNTPHALDDCKLNATLFYSLKTCIVKPSRRNLDAWVMDKLEYNLHP